MGTLNLAELHDGVIGRQRLAALFDEEACASGEVELEGHGLDTELLELADAFGRRLLMHAELREVLLEHQRAMQGLIHRVLRIAEVALKVRPDQFAEVHAADLRLELSFDRVSPGIMLRARDLLVLRQENSGRVVTGVGARLAQLSGGRWTAKRDVGRVRVQRKVPLAGLAGLIRAAERRQPVLSRALRARTTSR